MNDPRMNYVQVAPSERRAEDYAPLRRQLRYSLRPASIIGPALASGLIGAGLLLVWTLYVLGRP